MCRPRRPGLLATHFGPSRRGRRNDRALLQRSGSAVEGPFFFRGDQPGVPPRSSSWAKHLDQSSTFGAVRTPRQSRTFVPRRPGRCRSLNFETFSSIFLRVADIHAIYDTWPRAGRKTFLTPPPRQPRLGKIRCYLRDHPDGRIIRGRPADRIPRTPRPLTRRLPRVDYAPPAGYEIAGPGADDAGAPSKH